MGQECREQGYALPLLPLNRNTTERRNRGSGPFGLGPLFSFQRVTLRNPRTHTRESAVMHARMRPDERACIERVNGICAGLGP